MARTTNEGLPSKCRKKTLLVLFAWVCLSLGVLAFYQRSVMSGLTNMVVHTRHAPIMFVPYNKTTHGDGCKGFTNDPFHESIVKYFKREPTIDCHKGLPNFLYLDKEARLLKIDWAKAKSLGRSVEYCTYATIHRKKGSDLLMTMSPWSKTFTQSITIPDDVEHMTAKCQHGSRVTGLGYFSIIRKNSTKESTHEKNYKNHIEKNDPKETLSVLMVGIDGTSKNNFARHMVKTKKFILDELGAIELYKVNKVGLNTFPNVIPLLTGIAEKEIRTMWSDKEPFDKLNHLFLWDEAQRAGYRTSVILDRITITAFHFLKKGWAYPKFDYYYRPIVLQSEKNTQARSAGRYCVGNTPEISLYYEYWRQLATVFNNTKTTPYFGYSFFAHTTHDLINHVSKTDELYFQIFQNLVRDNTLNNTLVIFFSDHGCRYGEFRFTYRGMLEDNNPFMFFIFPPWFKSKYPKIMANFYKNQHRVLTNFDIYATLKDILYFKGDDIATRTTNKTFGISLFQELPVKRTCEEANIPLKYCNCRNLTGMQVRSDLSVRVSNTFLKHVISKTANMRDKCVMLALNSTISVLSIVTTSAKENFYQATIKTSPGGAVYEATLKSPKASNSPISVTGDVGRINMYRGQADCVSDARMRPFCYCKNLLS